MNKPTIPISPAAQSLIDAIKGCRGQYIKANFTSTVKGAAAYKYKVLTKTTTGVFRSGISYENLSSEKEGIASGERGEVQSLPWGEWALHPWLISHNGEEYLRLYPVDGQRSTVVYFVDGTEVDKATFQTYLTPSQCAEKDAPACITKKLAEVHFMGCWDSVGQDPQDEASGGVETIKKLDDSISAKELNRAESAQ